MIKEDFDKAYNFAVSKGITTIAANYFANKCCSYYYEAIEEDEEIMDDYFKMNFSGLPHEEIALIRLKSSIEALEQAKLWGHSDEWSLFYADYHEDGKDLAYDHIRHSGSNSIYNEAYTEYIVRGFSEKAAVLLASKLNAGMWSGADKIESIFQKYEVLFKEAKAKNKSDELANFYANYCCDNNICEDYAWTLTLFKEKLLNENRSEGYINNAIEFVSNKYDDITDETLEETNAYYYLIAGALGYAEGIEYAVKNSIPDAHNFAEPMVKYCHYYYEFNYLYPYLQVALNRTILEYNWKTGSQIPINQEAIDWLKKIEEKRDTVFSQFF